MKSVLFACLLIVAGVSAYSQDVDVDVATPDQGRLADTWIINRVRLLVAWIRYRGYDPFFAEEIKYDETFIDGIFYTKGFFQNLEVVGLSGIYINYVHYNIMLGRLDLDIVLAEVKIVIGKFVSEVRYGDIGGSTEVSGSFVISGVRLVGNALLSLFPGQPPIILNIATRLTVDSIESDLKISVKTLDAEEPTDVAETVNNFLNYRVLELIYIYEEIIGTIIGEIIRQGMNWGWPRVY